MSKFWAGRIFSRGVGKCFEILRKHFQKWSSTGGWAGWISSRFKHKILYVLHCFRDPGSTLRIHLFSQWKYHHFHEITKIQQIWTGETKRLVTHFPPIGKHTFSRWKWTGIRTPRSTIFGKKISRPRELERFSKYFRNISGKGFFEIGIFKPWP